jgi:hypothetical protein
MYNDIYDYDDRYIRDQLDDVEAERSDTNRSLMRATLKALTTFRARRLEPRDCSDIAVLYVSLKEEFAAIDRPHLTPTTVTVRPPPRGDS